MLLNDVHSQLNPTTVAWVTRPTTLDALCEQVLHAYPQFELFLERKRHFDPHERFTSDWYRHHVELMGHRP